MNGEYCQSMMGLYSKSVLLGVFVLFCLKWIWTVTGESESKVGHQGAV